MKREEFTILFKHPNYPPGMNGAGGLLRMHYHAKKKVIDKILWLMRMQKLKKFPDRVHVEIRNYAIILQDWDNLASRFKLVGDALVKGGYLKDDSPKYIVAPFVMNQYRVKKKDEVRLEFIITELED